MLPLVLLLAIAGLGTVEAAASPPSDDQPSGVQAAGEAEIVPPSVQTTITSADTPSRAGWYRRPVTVSFTCTPGSAPLVSPCPGPFRYSMSGEHPGQLFVVEAADGASTDVSTPVIRLDRVKPTVRVVGLPGSETRWAKIRCRADDRHSGVRNCTVRSWRWLSDRGAPRVGYRAVAVDNAGNRATAVGVVRVRR